MLPSSQLSLTGPLDLSHETSEDNLGSLCFVCVSSNDEQNSDMFCEQYSEFCETQTLSAPLGSPVLLPCIFSASNLSWVSWSHSPDTYLVRLTSKGRVKFVDPRHGRVKAFLNQGSEGNYSIRIDELKNTDLGCYRCEHEQNCLQVNLVAEIGTLSGERQLLIYICVGVAVFILLIVCGCCCMKFICDGAPPQDTGRVPADEQQRGQDTLVYENDDQGPANQQGGPTRTQYTLPGVPLNLDGAQPIQGTSGIYPDLNQFNFERIQSLRTKQRFHTELFRRLRQASLSRHYYVNQSEISGQPAMPAQANNHRRVFRAAAGVGKKKVRENCEYKNPIYNRSTDQLNHL
ncbi:uncharacterized protein LOC121608796 [Chelmon rostratus]|uniref:uncharacterized protein LOC121608796 n=1 Tax=Chelmon rostratus TaxID=109905 RepID=UPI001BEBE12F|nr:uncharacterized protein LOC121608796 [Chelmon rostratus]